MTRTSTSESGGADLTTSLEGDGKISRVEKIISLDTLYVKSTLERQSHNFAFQLGDAIEELFLRDLSSWLRIK